MTHSICTTVVEVKKNIHDTFIKLFDGILTLNDILMTNSICTTVVEVKKNSNAKYTFGCDLYNQNMIHLTKN